MATWARHGDVAALTFDETVRIGEGGAPPRETAQRGGCMTGIFARLEKVAQDRSISAETRQACQDAAAMIRQLVETPRPFGEVAVPVVRPRRRRDVRGESGGVSARGCVDAGIQGRSASGKRRTCKMILLTLCGFATIYSLTEFMLLAAQGSSLAAAFYLGSAILAFMCGVLLIKTEGDIHGRHRRAPAASYSNPAQTPGAAHAGAGLSIITFTNLSEPQPIENAGIRAGEIRAFRLWRVHGGHLHSAYVQHFRWPQAAPALGNLEQGGIFAFKEPGPVLEYLRIHQMMDREASLYSSSLGLPPFTSIHDIGLRLKFVIGTVDLYGEVIEHERGYRAEYARVASLDQGFGDVDLEALRARYLGQQVTFKGNVSQ
jgi:hypothetical protein